MTRDKKGRFKKGHIGWNKGKTNVYSKETKKKMKRSHIGQKAWNKGKCLSEEAKKHLRKINLGKHHTKKTKQKLRRLAIKNNSGKYARTKEIKEKTGKITKRQWKIGRFKNRTTPEYRKNLRIAQIKRVEKQMNDGMPLMPTIGNHETHILDTLEKNFGYEIFRQHRIVGYFLDGFCPALNLAIEVDEIKHHRRKYQEEKDMIRENNIKQELNCQFLRLEVD